MKFKGKTAVITGASVGIGRAVALQLAGQGASLILVDINIDKLNEVKKETEMLGADTLTYQCDISNEESVNEVINGGLKHYAKRGIGKQHLPGKRKLIGGP